MGEITRVEIENILHQWLEDGSGIPFIISESSTDGPRPANTYGTLKLSSLQNTESNYVEYENDLNDLNEIVRILPIITLSVNVFGNDAEDKILKIRSYIESSKSIEFLMGNFMGYQGMSDIRNLDILTHKTWEHRFQVDITIGLSGEYIYIVDPIESANIENGINGDIIEIP